MVGDSSILKFGNLEIPYSVTRTDRKSVGIIVDPDGSVSVRAPMDIEEEKIKEAVYQKRNWIVQKIEKTKEIKKPVPLNQELVSGEKILLKNRIIRLKIQPYQKKRTKISYAFRTLYLYVNETLSKEERDDELKKILMNWYREKAQKIITKRMEKYLKYLEVQPKGIAIRDQKQRWGSCTPEGNLIFNWRIAMAPLSAIDYVIVHELCHLQDPSHSAKFWLLIESLFPNYKKWKEYLRVNGPALDLRI